MDYKASKAWHLSHHLAAEVHELARRIPTTDQYSLHVELRRSSAIVPAAIAESIRYQEQKLRVECYHVARDAVAELQEQLQLARDRQYLDQKAFEQLASRAIDTYHLLTNLIQRSAHGTQYNQS